MSDKSNTTYNKSSKMPPVDTSNSVASYVEKLIAENKVVIFTKTTCPWCAKVIQLFNGINEAFTNIAIDTMGNHYNLFHSIEYLMGFFIRQRRGY